MPDTIYYIYKHTSKVTKKAYIGVSINLRKRWNVHTSRARLGSIYHFHRAIAKYGKENWEMEILCVSKNEEAAYELEIVLIAEHDTFQDGYNSTPGGRVPPKMVGVNHPLFGKPRSNETKQKISRNHSDVSGAKNPRARNISLLCPEGNLYNLKGTLKQFCKNKGIGYSTVCGQLCRDIIPTKGTFVGWKVWYDDAI